MLAAKYLNVCRERLAENSAIDAANILPKILILSITAAKFASAAFSTFPACRTNTPEKFDIAADSPREVNRATDPAKIAIEAFTITS